MVNMDDLNKCVILYNKYLADKQRHDLNIYSLTQKRVKFCIVIILPCFPFFV